MKNSTQRSKGRETDGSGLRRAHHRTHRTDRHHRPRLCRPAAGLPVRGEGLSGHRLRHRPAEGRRRSMPAAATSSTSRPSASRRCATSGTFDATADFARLERDGRDHHLRADAADQAPRAGPAASSSRPREAIAPHLRTGQLVVLESTHLSRHDARGAEADPRSDAASRSGATSSSPTRPSARIPATPISAPTTSRRWSAATARARCELAVALYDAGGGAGRCRSPRPRPRRR